MSAPEFWHALRRGWWIVLGVPLVTAAVLALTPRTHPLVFQVRTSLALDVPTDLVVPTSDAGAAKVGETLVDDISRVISGDVFAAAVAARLDTGSLAGNFSEGSSSRLAARVGGEITSSLSATDRHRVLDITVTRLLEPNKDLSDYGEALQIVELSDAVTTALTAIATAATDELTENGDQWFALLGAGGARLSVVDAPKGGRLPRTLRERLETPLRLGAALALGAAMALALSILDPRIQSPEQAVKATGLSILGSIGRRG